MNKLSFTNLFKPSPQEEKRPKKHRHYRHDIAPVVKKAETPSSPRNAADDEQESGPSTATVVGPGASMFPNDTILYKDKFRDMVLSTEYDSSLIRPLPLFYLAVRFAGGSEGQNAIIPLTLHRGHDKSGPVYGYVEGIERHTKATIFNRAYNPSAPFNTTIIDLDAHITREFCDFKFHVPSEGGNGVLELLELREFRWKQCKDSDEAVVLARQRAVEGQDWCWFERENDTWMKLSCIKTEEVLAVVMAAKSHSKMNPMKIAAKIKWYKSLTLTEELKLAALLAVMGYEEKTRRVAIGAGI